METTKLFEAAELLGVSTKELYKTTYDRTILNGNKLMQPACRFEDVLISKPLIEKINLQLNNYSAMLMDKEQIIEGRTTVIPNDSTPLIYFLFHDDYLIYIGQTFNFKSRIAQHRATKEIHCFTIEKQHRADLSLIELLYIDRYRPPLNNQVYNTNHAIKMIMDKIDLFDECYLQ